MHKTSIQVLFLVAIITIINYFDRSAISYAILPIQKELNVNDVQFGAIASGFGIGYLSVVVFGGILVDKFGSIKIWGISAALWSIVTIATGFADSFTSFFCLRLLLGIAEGVHFPALLKTLSDWLDVKYRGRSLSLALLGVPFSSVIGAPFLSFLIDATSWRWMFFILGTMGLIWSVIWTLFFRKKKNPLLSLANLPSEIKKNTHWKTIITSPPLLASCAIYFVFGYIVFFGLTWLPGFIEKTHSITISETGLLLTLPWIASSILLIVGGWLSDYLLKRTKSLRKARSYLIAMGLLLAAISFFSLAYTQNLGHQIMLLSLGLGFAFSINSSIYALNADLFPSHTGTAQGIMSCFFAIAGIISPALTGWLVQNSDHFHSAILFVSILTFGGSLIAFLLQYPKDPTRNKSLL